LYTDAKSAPFAKEQDPASEPDPGQRRSGRGGKWEKRHAVCVWQRRRVGGLLGRKKKGQPLGRPVMNGMKLLNMMFISIFPGNFSRALSLHCLSRSFFRICCMYS